ncbi:hypothetical protein [Cupriavidus gilardii]|uniref:hypothetical protein n=1 Tax=Cupriavidus gilardii TaxID=82541 RepID=UPI001573DC81|nr:hypothetical protein [Cupriavidus gilardii]NSX06138.1 hypothetical protein [Cupriavidus gilardii]
MPLTGFAFASLRMPQSAPWRQTPPPDPAAGKVGAGPVVLGGAACRIAAGKATASSGWIRCIESLLYGAWTGAAALLTAARSAQLPSIAHAASPAGWLAAAGSRLAEAMPVLATVEIAVTFAKWVRVVRKRGDLQQRIAATAGSHGHCEAALRQRLASRIEAALPAERAQRREQRQAMRNNGSLDAFLAHRHARAEYRDSEGKRRQAGIALARDTVVQGAVVGAGAAQILCRFLPTVAMALPGVGIAGCVTSVAMSLSQIVTGIVQRHDARKESALWQRRSEALRRSPLATALAGLEKHGAAGTVCAAAALSTRQQGIVGGADDAKTRQLTAFYRNVLQHCDDKVSAARQSAKEDARNAELRIAYGSGTLGVNGAMLGLTVAALTTVTAATAGMGLMVAGGVLGACWLGFAIYKMVKWWRGRREARAAAQTARQALETLTAQGAGPGKTVAEACAGVDAGKADTNSHLIATRVIEHLQARGSAQALAERTMARALMRALGADAEVIAGIEAAQTPKQCRLALKVVLRYLDGRCIDPDRQQLGSCASEADGASNGTVPAKQDARTPLLAGMADGAGAG